MTTTHTNLALVEGEVYVLSDYGEAIYKEDFIFRNCEVHKCTIVDGNDVGFRAEESSVYGDRNVYWQNSLCRKVLASTAKIEGIPQLDRKHFVKPKVDVDELASNYAEREQRVLWENEHIVSEAFKAGYNAKEGEFTQGDIAILWAAMILDNTLSLEYILFKLRSLSLPKSLTLNENNEVIHVTW